MSGSALGVHQQIAPRSVGVSNQQQPAGNVFKAVPYTVPFLTNSVTSYTLDLTNAQALGVIDQLQTAYIDNADNTEPLTITLNTGMRIVCPAFTQGWFPLFSSNPPILIFSSSGNIDVTVYLGNMPMPADQWSALASQAASAPVSLTDRSTTTVNPAASTTLMAANPDRGYLMIKAPVGVDLWINPFGGTASVGGSGCFLIANGGVYESGPRVWSGAITYFCATTGVVLSAAEG